MAIGITKKGLEHLGFTNHTDFILYDKSDGAGGYIHEWLSSDPQPTNSAIEAAEVQWQAAFDALAYQRTRAPLYAEIKEQLDQLYHDMAADKGDKTGEWFKAVKAVKDATPKP